ncbi:PAS domain S-box protein [Hymenobacter cellulosilyticus]|uniref:PAS domain S-box protein n=1 Tax=Hymenobacter cellulosilyticus TaxID=2932248 RepID=A0A8T9QF50_9BACT|nr:PAS domain S-box protein [Hymenobacter cellulosilyticus]UOQ75041.1 PAS domain S-box protein [Hymenobacter cellulosilyticus]
MAWRDVTAARAARVELLRQKEFSESLLDNSVDGILAFDQELRITAWNRVQEEFSGRSEAQVLGRACWSFSPNTPAASKKKECARCCRAGA